MTNSLTPPPKSASASFSGTSFSAPDRVVARPKSDWLPGKPQAQLKDQNLAQTCARTKAGCLRICCQGPTLVVYPEGTWYHGMTADRIPRLVQEHLREGKPIAEWIFANAPLKAE